MPVIQFNPGYFIELGLLPFPLIVVRLFLDGGWIPILIVLVQGFWRLWVQSRQMKYAATVTYTLLAIDVPRNNEQTPKAVEQIFSHLSAAYSGFDRYEKYWLGKFQPTFSFELVSIDGYVQFLVRTPTKFRDLIESSVFAQYPEAEIIEVADYADKIPGVYPDPEWDAFGTEYVLKKPNAFPLRVYSEFEHTVAEVPISDPMSAILEVMGSLRRGEQLWVQILLTPNDDSWKDAAQLVVDKILGKKAAPKTSIVDDVLAIPMMAVTEVTGMFAPSATPEKKPETPKIASLSPGEKNVLEAIQLKMSKIGFNTKMRLVYAGRRNVFSKGRVTQFKGALTQFTALNANALKNYGPVTPKGDYFWQRWSEQTKKMNVVRNYRNRSGRGAPPYVLNIEELATIYHFPMIQVKAPLVKKTEAKRAEPPVFLPTEENVHSSPFERVKPKPKEQPKPAPEPESDGEETDLDEDSPSNLPFA